MRETVTRLVKCCVLAFLVLAIAGGYFGVDVDALFAGLMHALPFLSTDLSGFAVIILIVAVLFLLVWLVFRCARRIFGPQIIMRLVLFIASGAILLDWLTDGGLGLGIGEEKDLGLVWIIVFIVCFIRLKDRIVHGPIIKGGSTGFGGDSIDVRYDGNGVWKDSLDNRFDGPLGAAGDTRSITHNRTKNHYESESDHAPFHKR